LMVERSHLRRREGQGCDCHPSPVHGAVRRLGS
jgi:hypothetical protein